VKIAVLRQGRANLVLIWAAAHAQRYLAQRIMSNCDFYATREDMFNVLDFVYSETDCRLFENVSAFGEELREFKSTEEIADVFDLGHCVGKHSFSALLQLYTPSASESFTIRKIDLDPGHCDGHTFRYAPNGWGLIQLYFGGVSE
jgi:hypothetical protein